MSSFIQVIFKMYELFLKVEHKRKNEEMNEVFKRTRRTLKVIKNDVRFFFDVHVNAQRLSSCQECVSKHQYFQ